MFEEPLDRRTVGTLSVPMLSAADLHPVMAALKENKQSHVDQADLQGDLTAATWDCCTLLPVNSKGAVLQDDLGLVRLRQPSGGARGLDTVLTVCPSNSNRSNIGTKTHTFGHFHHHHHQKTFRVLTCIVWRTDDRQIIAEYCLCQCESTNSRRPSND